MQAQKASAWNRTADRYGQVDEPIWKLMAIQSDIITANETRWAELRSVECANAYPARARSLMLTNKNKERWEKLSDKELLKK